MRLRNNNCQVNKASRILTSATWLLMSALILNLNGCATPNQPKAEVSNINEYADESHENSLRPEFIYKYLIGEISGQRGEIATSGAIFYDLARSERDPRLAERAAKIAAYGNIPNLAIPAIKLWAELDPSSIEAQQAMTEMLIATGKLKETEPYLANLLLKEETRANGFIYISGLLNKSADKAGALQLIQSLAEPYPQLPEAQLAIAQAAGTAGQNETALQALTRAETLRPGWILAAILKGQVLFQQSPQATIDFYRAFLMSHPNANEIRINLAKILVNQKQYAEAKKEYPVILEYAANNTPENDAEITLIIGLLSYQASDYSAAENYFKQALALDIKDTDQVYIYLGQVAEKQQHDDEAIDWYSKITSGSRYLEAQINLANIIARTQTTDKAIALLSAIEDLNTQQQIIVIQSQANLLAKAKRNEEAFQLLENGMNNLPNTSDLIYDYALAAERVKKFDLMESELRKAITERPDFAAAYNALGYSFADRNIRLNEAVKLIKKALEIAPNDHYMLDSLGWAYYRKGDLDQALTYLQQAYNTSQDPEIAAHLGEVLWHKGRHDEARKIWDEALINHPDNEILITTANKFKS